MRYRFWIFICFIITEVAAQDRKPVGKILADKIEVGKPFKFSLSYLNTGKGEVFFPDEFYDFSPYELVGQEFFTSKTTEKGSLDSTIFRFVSYEVAPVQVLSLPVYIRTEADCTAVFSAPDSVFIKLLTAEFTTDSLAVKPDVALLPLEQRINFPAVFVTAGVLLLLFIVVFSFFGLTLKRYWKLIKLFISHRDFRLSFLRIKKNIKDKKQVKEVERATVLWKKYLEKLLKLPFATYTTKEILDTIPNEQLMQALKDIDGIIYGHSGTGKTIDDLLNVLKDIAEEAYQQKKSEVRMASEN